MLSWVSTAYLLAAATLLVPFGRIGDIYGRKKVFMLGMLIFSFASVICAFSVSEPMIIAGRLLQGLGGAMLFGTNVAILTSVFKAGERGKVLGINATAVYLGISLGPFLGGLLTQSFGWRSIFALNAMLGLFIIVLIFFGLKGEWQGAKGEKFDYKGSVIYCLSIPLMIYGLSILPAWYGILFIVYWTSGFSRTTGYSPTPI
jgi:MFS family permease